MAVENAYIGPPADFYRQLLDISSDPIFCFAPDFRYLYANQAFAAGIGRNLEEIVGRTVWDVFPKDQADKRATLAKWVFDHGEAKAHEMLVRGPNGDRHYLTTVTPIFGNQGQVSSVLVNAKDITKRKQAEAALSQSDTFLRIIIDSVFDQVAVIDQDGMIVLVNEPWRRYSLENSLQPGKPAPCTDVGTNYMDVCRASAGSPEDGSQAVLEGLQAVLDGTRPSFSMVYPCHSADQQRWFTMRALPLGGNRHGAVIAHTDITEQTLANEAVLHSESLLKSVTAAVPGVVFQFSRTSDGEWKFLYLSKGLEDLYEVTAEEARRDHRVMAECVMSEDRESLQEAVKRSVKGLSDWEHEHRIRTPSGKIKWVRGNATLQRQADGSALWTGILTDISESKQAEQQLETSEARLKLALSGGKLGLWDWNIPSSEVLYSEHWFSMLGLPLGQAKRDLDSWLNRVHPDDLATVNAALEAHLKGQAPAYESEHRVRHQDGHWLWLLDRGRVVEWDKAGAPFRAVGIYFDITDRKNLVHALQLKNLELQHATMAAEKANHAKSQFLSSMSHELRTPLNSILGFAQLLESGTPAPTALQHRNIGEILRGGWYLLTLINEILDLALIESGKLALSMEPLLLSKVMLDCQSVIEPMATAREIKVNFPPLNSSLLIVADPIRLKQVIINLLSNAVKYNRAKGTVDVKVSSGEERALRISVHDTGVGIPAEKLSQLFQPFSRLGQEGITTDGTGIGLVVTKHLTELMGGRVGVQSTLGVGSIFWVELNAGQEPSPSKDIQPDLAGRPNQVRADGTACSILYVEDNIANVELVEQMLADRSQLKLLRAQDGIQGIEMARAHLPAVILMDINLPGLSGLEVLNVLRQDPATSHIPILAISANAMPFDIAHGLAAGFFCYLTKPFKINEFLEMLDSALVVALNKAPTTQAQPELN